MGANTTGSEDQLAEIRRRFDEDQAFSSVAETDLEGTLRDAGLPADLVSRFVVSDTDEHGNKGMGLRSEIWVCEIGEGFKRCWCVSCPIA
jgi:hypothetical protein